MYRGKLYISVFTLRRIARGEQLTVDYGLYLDEAEDPRLRIPCLCGTEACRGYINPTREGPASVVSSPEN